MNRVWDDLGFVVWFVGLGYIVWWLAGAPEQEMLTPPLHIVGLAAAVFVAVRLIILAIRRWRMPVCAAAPASAEGASTIPAPPLPTVKPRRQFGLRDGPH